MFSALSYNQTRLLLETTYLFLDVIVAFHYDPMHENHDHQTLYTRQEHVITMHLIKVVLPEPLAPITKFVLPASKV